MFEISFGRVDPPDPGGTIARHSGGRRRHAMLPTLGMGANLALRDARLLTDQLRAVRQHRAELIGIDRRVR